MTVAESYILTDTVRIRDLDGGEIAAGRYLWRGPANVPVFSLENCRDITSAHVDVVCETACEAVVLVERTRTGPSVIPSTNHGFTRWRIYGNGLAGPAFWYRGIDENNEHGRWDSCAIYDCGTGWTFEGQQSKEHLITHCMATKCVIGIIASSSFLMIGGTIAVAAEGIRLFRSGDPVTVIGTGFEACERLLVTAGPTTDAQPVVLQNVRYAADQLREDRGMIVMRHAGPLTILGGSYGDGDQRLPQIHLAGIGEQGLSVMGAKFGSYGADVGSVVKINPGVRTTLHTGALAFQRSADSSDRTTIRPGI